MELPKSRSEFAAQVEHLVAEVYQPAWDAEVKALKRKHAEEIAALTKSKLISVDELLAWIVRKLST